MKFTTGDKVRLVGNPVDLPDDNGVGTFNYPEHKWKDKVFTVGRLHSSGTCCELVEDNGYWWFDFRWLIPAKVILVGGE